jgi:hypothetical protein
MPASIESSAIVEWVSQSLWAFPILLTVHVFGMATCIGMSWMLSARTVGFGRAFSIDQLSRLMAVGWLGAAFAGSSGLLLFVGQATHYIGNPAFRLKIALIVSALATNGVLLRLLRKDGRGWRLQFCASLSAALWLAALVAGRMVGYIDVGGAG